MKALILKYADERIVWAVLTITAALTAAYEIKPYTDVVPARTLWALVIFPSAVILLAAMIARRFTEATIQSRSAPRSMAKFVSGFSLALILFCDFDGDLLGFAIMALLVSTLYLYIQPARDPNVNDVRIGFLNRTGPLAPSRQPTPSQALYDASANEEASPVQDDPAPRRRRRRS